MFVKINLNLPKGFRSFLINIEYKQSQLLWKYITFLQRVRNIKREMKKKNYQSDEG